MKQKEVFMKELKGTKTEQNLINSFAGESQARNRYTYFASIAKKEGYEQIAAIFLETADNEKEHAKLFYKHLGNLVGHVDSNYPFFLGTTEENLQSALDGEREEAEIIYKEAAKIAKEEGFEDIAHTFEEVMEVEEHHMKRYQQLLKNIQNDTVFKKEKTVEWKCRNCGYIHEDTSAPKLCPCCKHPRCYFQIHCEKF